MPASREDRVLRLLLTEPDSWDRLSAEEHHLLLDLPAPHGPLFVWLEGQMHEHGPQPWAALREGLRAHPHEKHAIAQIAQIMKGIEGDWDEVRGILDQLAEMEWKRELKNLSDDAAETLRDPVKRQRLELLTARARIAGTSVKKAAQK